MSTELVLAACDVVLTVLLICLAVELRKYVAAFKRTATKLYNVTADRDALFIENAGLRSRLGKVSTLKPERRE